MLQKPSSTPSLLDSLLAEAGWAARLSRALVRDPASAEDLTQDAWVAALRSEPTTERALRPWLRRVLRNLASNQTRDEGRRRVRESMVGAALPRDHERTSPETLVDRVRLQRLLADLVMSLEEPFRQTLLLRYYEGLSAADIARRLDAPQGTVRWRLKEALDRLRKQLEGTEGATWRASLAPLTAMPLPAAKIGPLVGSAAAAKPAFLLPMLGAAAGIALLALVAVAFRAYDGLGAPANASKRTPSPAPESAESSERSNSAQPGLPGNAQGPRLPVPRLIRAPVAAPGPEAPRPRYEIETATATVTGNLGGEVVARIVRRHINEVNYCYEQELAKDPLLEGTLELEFDISSEGLVSASRLSAGTITNLSLQRCLLIAVRRWQFPRPAGGGVVTVRHPFVFRRGD